MIGQLLTGRYLILEKLGMGGFSETYLARDKYLPHHPLCVVKCLKLSPSSRLSIDTAHQFFDTEARLLEQLGRDYAQIPTLLAYCQEQDQVYLVQEYIDGENLADWFGRGEKLTPKQAIALLLELLPVLDYLYTYRVVHRDITPSNLIQRRRDGKVVLIDFGAARVLPETAPNAEPVSSALAVGTPGYMSDEQQLGMSQLNSDLYALGVLVIQFLTGVPPQQFQRNRITGELNWHQYLPDPKIEPKLIRVLDRMVQNSFRDRYQSAADVLVDLQSLPKSKFSWAKEGMDWSNVLQKASIPALAVLTIVGVGGWYLHTHSKQAGSVLARTEHLFSKPQVQLNMLHEMPVQEDVVHMVIAPNNQILVTAEADHSLRLWSLPQGNLLRALPGHTAPITTLAISRNNQFLVSGSADGRVFLWDINSGQLLRSFKAYPYPVTAIAISPDNQTCVSGHKNGALRQWNMQTGISLPTLQPVNTEVRAIAYGATPNRLIIANSDRQLQVWDLATGQLERTLAGHTDTILGLQVKDDNTLFSFGQDRGFVWDVVQGKLIMVLPEVAAKPVAAALSDQKIVTVYNTGDVRVWNEGTGQLATAQGVLGQNLDAAISPNQNYLVSWNSNQRLQIWRINASAVP